MKISEYFVAFSRFILVKSTKIRFSCLEDWYMPRIVPKLVPWVSLHHKDHKTYTQCGVKTNIFWYGVPRSVLVAERKILFWQAAAMPKHFVVCQKRILRSATKALFLTRDQNILVFTPHYRYVLWSLWCQESHGTNFRTIRGIYQCSRQENEISLISPKWSVGERQNILQFSHDFHEKCEETFFPGELQNSKHDIYPSCKVSKHPFRLVLQADKKNNHHTMCSSKNIPENVVGGGKQRFWTI